MWTTLTYTLLSFTFIIPVMMIFLSIFAYSKKAISPIVVIVGFFIAIGVFLYANSMLEIVYTPIRNSVLSGHPYTNYTYGAIIYVVGLCMMGFVAFKNLIETSGKSVWR